MISPPALNGSIVAHPPDSTTTRHLPHLDALRGIAALLVVLHHAHFEGETTNPLIKATSWMREGHFLVTFFIILSGYCLTLPTIANGRLREGLWTYLKRRAWRLLPAYYAALVGSLILIATIMGKPTGRHWDFALPVTWQSIVTHFLLIHNYELADLYKINHVFWSIAVEWQVYFAFPIFVLLARKIGPWWTTALAMTLGLVGYYQLVGTTHFGLTPHYYGMFALGMLAATIAHSTAWEYALKSVSWWSLAALSILAMASIATTSAYEILDIPFGVACAAALVALSEPSRIRTWLEGRRLVALGGISYSLYLVHAPLQHLIVEQVFWRVGLNQSLEFPILAIVGTPVIIAIASAFHRTFERPFLPTRNPGRSVPAPMGIDLGTTAQARVDQSGIVL